MNYVTDTHSLVWYFTEDPRLGTSALNAFESTINEGIIFIPAVVLAEIMYIAQRGRITISFEETVKRIEETENFEVAPLSLDILKVADKIDADMEMHDKLIVAAAKYLEAVLITKDENISDLKIVLTVW
ncbi:MAG: PIN domain-containing protein [Nitrospiraceae bacterium]|nr:PIN domain-containing protein [Nitrospiraceae bacterium]